MSNQIPHNEEHFDSPDFVKDIVIGMADGLTVPFALAAGLSGAVDTTSIIVTAGIAEIAAGSIAMGLGGYLAGRTEVDHYDSELKREYFEADTYPEKEKQEVRDVLHEYGVSETSSKIIADEMSRDKEKWVKFMMRFELGLEKPDAKRARQSALNIGLAYIVGGLVPLAPYFFAGSTTQALMLSVVVTLIALFIFGFLKAKATGQPPFAGALKTTLIGAIAAAAAFGIAKAIQ
ncbi:MAG TPA: VIT1/CCC1 transporter family protein [Chitinophagales bacterium]|nr:VIT1/CCC1 transporter family protein [Chitinophagales bacterium]